MTRLYAFLFGNRIKSKGHRQISIALVWPWPLLHERYHGHRGHKVDEKEPLKVGDRDDLAVVNDFSIDHHARVEAQKTVKKQEEVDGQVANLKKR